MSALLVLGAGGHGKVVADAALSAGEWSNVAFIDDDPGVASVLGYEVIGQSADLPRLRESYSAVVVAVGNAHVRLRLLAECASLGFELPSIVHARASVSRFSSLGPGCVVFAQAAVNPAAVLGKACIVNTGASVDHDCVLGDGVHVCPGARLAGDVRVGARSWIGIGASVLQGVQIGSDVTLGAGAAVVTDIESGVTAVGVPARVRGKEA